MQKDKIGIVIMKRRELIFRRRNFQANERYGQKDKMKEG